jgi:large subunit ribosomal protein L25
MATRSLNAELRPETKKGAAGRLRNAGWIPAVMYGHREPVLLSVNAREFAQKFRTISESTLIELSAGGENYDVLVKDFQVDNLADRLLHIDFFEIEPNKTLRARVLLHFVGTAIGVREGGVLELLLHEIDVESLPRDLPEAINVAMEPLQIGESIHVRDLLAPDGVRIVNPEEQVVALVAHRLAEEVAEEEAPGADELLGDDAVADAEESEADAE